MQMRSILSIAILLCCAFIAKADSLDETALKILANSPEYKSEAYSLETLSKSMQTEANLPDPQLDGEFLAAPPGETNRWGAELSWGVEWPGVYKARNEAAQMKTMAAQKSIDADRLNRLTEIKQLLLDYVAQQKKLQLLEHLAEDNDSIYTLASVAAKGGEMTLLDLNKVRLENANIRASKAGIYNERTQTLVQLAAIYGGDVAPLLSSMKCEFPDIILPSSDEISRMAATVPDVASAKADADAARQDKKVVAMESLPSLSVGYKHAFEDGAHFNGATLGVSIPIFSSRNKKAAAEAAISEAEYKADAAKTIAQAEITETVKRIALMKAQIDEIKPLLNETEHHELLLKAYKGGAITLIDYLTERNYFTTAALELLSLQHSAASALISLRGFSSL